MSRSWSLLLVAMRDWKASFWTQVASQEMCEIQSEKWIKLGRDGVCVAFGGLRSQDWFSPLGPANATSSDPSQGAGELKRDVSVGTFCGR